MNVTSGSGILFTISAIAVAAAMFLILFVAVLALAYIFGLAPGWADLLVRYFPGTGLGFFTATLGFFVISVVRCFSGHGETFAALLWLMVVAGLMYAMMVGLLGLAIYVIVSLTLGWKLSAWILWLIGFFLFILLRLAFSADRATDR